MFIHNWLQKVSYRLGQVCQQLGFVSPLTEVDLIEVESCLPNSALSLFRSMSLADQQHSLRVYRGLLAHGCEEKDLLIAALLHDVGKAQGRVPFWTRPVLVLGKALAPGVLRRSIVDVERLEAATTARWRRAISYTWWHAEIGSQLAASVGLSEQVVLYIRTHHQAHGPAALLHKIDEES